MNSAAVSGTKAAGRERPRGGARLLVLASGRGSNFQALLDAGLASSICGLICDQPGAPVLERARAAGLPALLLRRKKTESRNEYCARLAEAAAGLDPAGPPDFVFLLGWMRLLSNSFLSRFPGRVINLHPALPGAFPGLEAIAREYEAFRAGTLAETGIMVHYVPDEGMDSGPVIAVEKVPISAEDSPESFEARVHETEHRLVVRTALALVRGDLPPWDGSRQTAAGPAPEQQAATSSSVHICHK